MDKKLTENKTSEIFKRRSYLQQSEITLVAETNPMR